MNKKIILLVFVSLLVIGGVFWWQQSEKEGRETSTELPNCANHSGIFESSDGSKVFCADGKMWSTTLASGYEWGHYGETTGDCSIHPGNSSYPACYACETLDYAGFSDWYLPSKDTLAILRNEEGGYTNCGSANCTGWDPYCCASLINNYESANYKNWDPYDPYCCASLATNSSSYWSSTEYKHDNNCAWVVYFTNGLVSTRPKSGSNSVRCVR